jgi:hypothetical protein
MLAGSPLGCTEAIMLAHGFIVEILERVVLDGLATATPGTVHAGGRPIKVTWLTITDQLTVWAMFCVGGCRYRSGAMTALFPVTKCA